MKLLLLLPLLAVTLGINFAYAEPLESIQINVLNFDGDTASIQVTFWDDNPAVTQYEIGCVSCIPNSSELTSESSITINNVSPFPDSTNALLYIVSYDADNEIVNAKQVFLNLEE